MLSQNMQNLPESCRIVCYGVLFEHRQVSKRPLRCAEGPGRT